MFFLIRIFVFWLLIYSMSFANEVKVFDFTEVELSKLEVRKVRGADKRDYFQLDQMKMVIS